MRPLCSFFSNISRTATNPLNFHLTLSFGGAATGVSNSTRVTDYYLMYAYSLLVVLEMRNLIDISVRSRRLIALDVHDVAGRLFMMRIWRVSGMYVCGAG